MDALNSAIVEWLTKATAGFGGAEDTPGASAAEGRLRDIADDGSVGLVAACTDAGTDFDQLFSLAKRSGVVRWLRSQSGAPTAALEGVARELAGRAVATTTTEFDIAVLNVDRDPTIEEDSYGDWEVWLPGPKDLARLAPVAATAEYAGHLWPFDKELHTDVVLLRTHPEPVDVPTGSRFHVEFRQAPWLDAWRPLLLFNVFVPDAAVQVVQHGHVTVGDRTQLVGTLPTEPFFHGERNCPSGS